MDIVDEYISLLPSSIAGKLGGLSMEKTLCVQLLETATEACPGLGAALLLMGKVKMQIGDFNGSSHFFVCLFTKYYFFVAKKLRRVKYILDDNKNIINLVD